MLAASGKLVLKLWQAALGVASVALVGWWAFRPTTASANVGSPPSNTPAAPPQPKPSTQPGSGVIVHPIATALPVSGDYGYTLRPRYKRRFSGVPLPKDKKYFRFHRGVDISCPMNTPLRAILDGEVLHAGHPSKLLSFFGIYVLCKHEYQGKTIYSLFAHCNSVNVQKGDKIKQGQVVAHSGNTGNSAGPHLHWEVWHRHWNYRRNDDHTSDPIPLLRAAGHYNPFRPNAIRRVR